VGGTNPSLLEAMATGALISAHDNQFNRAALTDLALYFSSAEEVAKQQTSEIPFDRAELSQKLKARIVSEFSWKKISLKYLHCFSEGKKANR
jgi:glycosyltransferase involved in cell wall biosynthesis